MESNRKLCLLIALAWCAVASAGAQSTRLTSATTERIERKTYAFKHGDVEAELEYALYVPSNYDRDESKRWPLIVALHGLGSNPQQIMRYQGLTDLAERRGYIVVAPMGFNNSGWYGSRGPGGAFAAMFSRTLNGEQPPDNLGELSEKDVMNVLEIVRKDYRVDPRNIFLMGHSMGGGGTWHLGTKHPEIWAGLAPIAPAINRLMSEDSLEKIEETPVIVVQGDADRVVPVEGSRRWVAKMKELEMTHVYIEVAGGDHMTVAWREMPKIFDFFDKHRRAPKERPVR